MPQPSPQPLDLNTLPRIVSARNDLLTDETGHTLIDLFSAHGTTFLGHNHPTITAAVAEQLHNVWLTGGLPTPALDRARTLINALFPDTHHLAALYSTGMEAAEYAMRLARVATGKSHVIGFEGAMHGKSLATATLAWRNPDAPSPPHIHRLPNALHRSYRHALDVLQQTFDENPVSAVFLEPLHASGSGAVHSPQFCEAIHELCERHNALLVFDEVLTGLHRLGRPFFFSQLNFTPDIVLLGKSLANGFPASAVVARKDIPIDSRSLPGSTFASNPLAATAVAATLRTMQSLDLADLISRLEPIIAEALAPLAERHVCVRGQGLLWILLLPTEFTDRIPSIVSNLYRRGVFVSHTPMLLRILPAATIDPDNLKLACTLVREEIQSALKTP